MASLFESLAVTGHRLSTGAANASGLAWFYEAGSTTSLATVYADADGTSTASNPTTLNAGGKATVYFVGKVDVRFETAAGVEVETLSLSERADRVEVENDGFTGLNTSGSLVAGGKTDLDAVLTSLFASFGGLDGKYKEFTGATARTLQSVLRGIQVSVKDYGAVGNNVADDTAAIQSAINEVARLGGGTVYIDPGTYITSAALTLTSKNGVSIVGAGRGVSIIKNNNGTSNGLVFSACARFQLSGFTICSSTGSSGTAIVMSSSCSVVDIDRVGVSGDTGSTFAQGIVFSGAGTATINITRTGVTVTSAVGARCVKFGAGVSGFNVQDCNLSSSTGASIEIDGAVSYVTVSGCILASDTGIKWAATSTGAGFIVFGNPNMGGLLTPFDLSALSADPNLRQFGNSADGYTVNVATGNSHTPTRSKGSFVRIVGNSGGAGTITVNAPTPAPTATMRGMELTIEYVNALGGAAVVTWAFAAATFNHVGGAVPSGTDGTTVIVRYLWDPDTSRWREITRGQTTT